MIVNVDYIGVIRFSDGKYRYQQVPIMHSNELLMQLNACGQEECSTRLDLQSVFSSYIPHPQPYNYCYPLEYYHRSDSSQAAGMPPYQLTMEEYEGAISHRRKELLEKYPSISVETMERELDSFKRLMRKTYYEHCVNYIRAYDYERQLECLRADTSIRMFSTEPVGFLARWANQYYHISQDIEVSIHTNFAFGNASRFTLNLTYNGIPIYLYSKYVQYYYAEKVDIIECTNDYRPARENWELALKFVEKAANLAQDSTEAFVNEYLASELDRFMTGIRDLYRNPSIMVQKIVNLTAFHERTSPYVRVRHICAGEWQDFKAYPYEMALSFRLGKLTGALEFLETLKSLSDIYPRINHFIEEIKTINCAIAPDVKSAIAIAERDILALKKTKEQYQLQLLELKKKKESLDGELSDLKGSLGDEERRKIDKEFRLKHPGFETLYSQIIAWSDKVDKVMGDIYFRNHYKEWLERDLTLLNTYLDISNGE